MTEESDKVIQKAIDLWSNVAGAGDTGEQVHRIARALWSMSPLDCREPSREDVLEYIHRLMVSRNSTPRT